MGILADINGDQALEKWIKGVGDVLKRRTIQDIANQNLNEEKCFVHTPL